MIVPQRSYNSQNIKQSTTFIKFKIITWNYNIINNILHFTIFYYIITIIILLYYIYYNYYSIIIIIL